MIRQYHAQRRQGGTNPLGVGVIAAGAIFYLQNDGWWRDRYRGKPVCRTPLDRHGLPQWDARRRPAQPRHRTLGRRPCRQAIQHSRGPLAA